MMKAPVMIYKKADSSELLIQLIADYPTPEDLIGDDGICGFRSFPNIENLLTAANA